MTFPCQLSLIASNCLPILILAITLDKHNPITQASTGTSTAPIMLINYQHYLPPRA